MFRTLLEYKAERYGREVRVISRWEPTSQSCSACGHQDGKKSLSVRTWTCPVCGSAHERDSNAAKNTLAATQAERLNACGVKSKSSLLVADREAGTRLDRGHYVPPEERQSPSVTAGRMSTPSPSHHHLVTISSPSPLSRHSRLRGNPFQHLTVSTSLSLPYPPPLSRHSCLGGNNKELAAMANGNSKEGDGPFPPCTGRRLALGLICQSLARLPINAALDTLLNKT